MASKQLIYNGFSGRLTNKIQMRMRRNRIANENQSHSIRESGCVRLRRQYKVESRFVKRFFKLKIGRSSKRASIK